jgi:hypothetical protein
MYIISNLKIKIKISGKLRSVNLSIFDGVSKVITFSEKPVARRKGVISWKI